METTLEIFKMALQNEVRASTFYAKAAEITENDESRMLFLELSHMEDDHARRLVERSRRIAPGEPLDAQAHLQRLQADTARDLGVEETGLIRSGDMRSVVEFSIGLEATARDKYLALASRLENADDRAFCEGLAAEEQKHFDSLTNLRTSMDMDMEERPML
jgi:rubrerythrin